ncbi:MAG: ABC transporter permease, partial [Planctomycetota bacterium]
MRKIFLVARRDYQAMVGSKAFLVVLMLMPLLMFGGIIGHKLFEDRAVGGEKRIVVIDGTGKLFD